MVRLLIVILVLAFLAYGVYYQYIETVRFSEIMGSSGNAAIDIFVNLLDFDTGCTRHELSALARKSQAWNVEMNRINTISDLDERNRQNTELMAEMMRDPAFRKLSQKFLVAGARGTKGLLETLAATRGVGLF